jgi:hypothetical protein
VVVVVVLRVVRVVVGQTSSAKMVLMGVRVVAIGMRRTSARAGPSHGVHTASWWENTGRGLDCRSVDNRGSGHDTAAGDDSRGRVGSTLNEINPTSTSGEGRDRGGGEDSDESKSGLGRHVDDDLN